MTYKALTADITEGRATISIVGMGDYMPAQMYSELESKNAELMAQVSTLEHRLLDVQNANKTALSLYDESVKEVQALKAQVYAVNSAGITVFAHWNSSNDVFGAMNKLKQALALSPAEALHQVKAESVDSFVAWLIHNHPRFVNKPQVTLALFEAGNAYNKVAKGDL